MIEFIWHDGEPPKYMKVRQVYAVAFDETGRVLIKKQSAMFDGKMLHYGMFGGTPEDFDSDRIETLKREFLEEANTTLKDPIYLVGYQVVKGDGEDYVQLRMVAMIDKIGPKKPDPDCGKVHGRILTTPERAIELLSWGDAGKKTFLGAQKIAKEKFGIETTRFDEESV